MYNNFPVTRVTVKRTLRLDNSPEFHNLFMLFKKKKEKERKRNISRGERMHVVSRPAVSTKFDDIEWMVSESHNKREIPIPSPGFTRSYRMRR